MVLPDEELRRYQEAMVEGHAGGVGPRLPTAAVRAAILVRVNGMARGGSGASPGAVETLVAMLNSGVHPIVPAVGSVGAGDLPQMAGIALAAMGKGRAEHRGTVLDAAAALKAAGIAPLTLEPKDGLSLMSANGVSIGHGALVIARAEEVAQVSDVVAALSLEAVGGNPSAVQPAVGAAKPFPGQIEACRHILGLLEGSHLQQPGEAASVQDPLSLRVVPQVHGAAREFIVFARRAVETELNSKSDNPLVVEENDTMIHNGNFHPMVMALAFDALRPALAHLGQLSDRRMSHLWDAIFASPGFAPSDPSATPREFFGLSLRYPAAALFAELKQLAAPASLDCPPLDIGVEDRATSAPLCVAKSERALDLLEDILAIELILARDLLRLSPRRRLGAGTGAALDAVEDLLEGQAERSATSVHEGVRAGLRSEVLAAPRRSRP